MNKLASIQMFVAVAESLNLGDAAKQLGVSSSVVTRSLTTLEQGLGVRLVNRTTRHVSVTPVGKRYLDHARDLLRVLEEMDECVAEATHNPSGSLRIAASASFASTELPNLLADYRSHHPRIDYDLTVFDNLSTINPSSFDVCFSADRRLRDSTLISKPIATTTDVIVATPAYLKRRGAPRVPTDLSSHDILVASDAPSRYWDFKDNDGTQRVVVQPFMNMQSPLVVRQAVCAGLGIARLPRSIVQRELSDGVLCSLLSDAVLCSGEWTVWMLYVNQVHLPRVVRGFVDFVVGHYDAKGTAPLPASTVSDKPATMSK